MKGEIRSLFVIIISILIFSTINYAQGSKYCKMLGKTFKEVRNVYGTPTFQNLDEPTMEWIFYQVGSEKVTFVSNENNVFQVQVDIKCDSQNESKKKLDGFFKECVANNMKIDTLKDGNFKIVGNGINLDLYISDSNVKGSLGFKYKAVLIDGKKD